MISADKFDKAFNGDTDNDANLINSEAILCLGES